MTTLRGVLPVVQTPFDKEEQIDAETLQKEIDWLFKCGVNGIVMGMVSETVRLTDLERDELVRDLVNFTAGRGPVVASVGAESSRQAIRHAQAAEKFGASALMAIPPALTRCSSDEISSYYRLIVKNTSLPLVVQDASGYLGNAIPVSTQAALWREFPNRILFKPEAQPIGANLSALRDATLGKALILEGTGGIALVDSYHRGVIGTMPGSDLAWAVVALWNALVAKNETKIRAIQGPLTSIIAFQTSLDAFLTIEKMLLVYQGVFSNATVRGPVGFDLDRETTEEILRLFHLLQNCILHDR